MSNRLILGDRPGLSSKRDHRIAAGVLGYEAARCLQLILFVCDSPGGESYPHAPWRKSWNDEAERQAVHLARKAAHHARLGVVSLTEPERTVAVA